MATPPGTSPPARVPTVVSLPPDASGLRACHVRIALTLGVSLDDARRLCAELPAKLPVRLSQEQAQSLWSEIERLGGRLIVDDAPAGPIGSCQTHPTLDAGLTCERCGAVVCSACAARTRPATLCESCARRKRRSRAFYRVRVAVLLMVLASVCTYAWVDLGRRRARTSWKRPLYVAIVVRR